jgi:hypothetical protein
VRYTNLNAVFIVVGLLSALAGLLLGANAHAGEDLMHHDTGYWLPVTLELPTTAKSRILLEAQPRWEDKLRRFSTLQIRPSVEYDVNQKVRLRAGYLWGFNRASTPAESHQYEHRLFEEATVVHKLDKLKVNHRLRLEQRHFSQAGNRDSHLSWRGRYQLRGEYPLGQSHWSLVSANEALINLNDTRTADQGLNQIRVFTGVNRKLGKWARIEAGYQWVLENQPHPEANVSHHLILTRLTIMPYRLGVRSEPGNLRFFD